MEERKYNKKAKLLGVLGLLFSPALPAYLVENIPTEPFDLALLITASVVIFMVAVAFAGTVLANERMRVLQCVGLSQ